jgi:hypothetical protein
MDCCGIRQWPPIKLLCRRNAAARLKPQGEPRVLARLAGVRRRREFKRADSVPRPLSTAESGPEVSRRDSGQTGIRPLFLRSAVRCFTTMHFCQNRVRKNMGHRGLKLILKRSGYYVILAGH